jgi:hypothetical protein
MDGANLKPIVSSMYEQSKFIKECHETGGFNVYGQKNHVFGFMSDFYSEDFEYDTKKVKGFFIDIETFSGYEDEHGVLTSGPFTQPTISDTTFKSDAELTEYKNALIANVEYLKSNTDDYNPDIDFNQLTGAEFPINMIQIYNT